MPILCKKLNFFNEISSFSLTKTLEARSIKKAFSEYDLSKKKAPSADPNKPPIYEKKLSILSKLRVNVVDLLLLLKETWAYRLLVPTSTFWEAKS